MTKSYIKWAPTTCRRANARGRYRERGAPYDEVIYKMGSDDMPPSECEGALPRERSPI